MIGVSEHQLVQQVMLVGIIVADNLRVLVGVIVSSPCAIAEGVRHIVGVLRGARNAIPSVLVGRSISLENCQYLPPNSPL